MKLSLSVFFCALLAGSNRPASALSVAGVAAGALKDHTSDAVNLFNNMRAPASLIGGSLVPLGLLSAPTINEKDSKVAKFMKKANIIIAILSVLSEILAVTYSSIAINKLVEVPQPATAGVAALISQNHEFAWIGTNVHFLLGMMGFALIAGTKAYFAFGKSLGKVGWGWSVAAFLQGLSIINKGIAMGNGPVDDVSQKFAGNFFGLIVRYISLAVKNSKGGVCSMAAIALSVYATYHTIKILFESDSEETKSA